MSRSLLHLVLHHAEGFAGGSAEPDLELLARFARSRDEAAFAELVRRHASMVWAVCRQSLAGDADAEDAFQATFLALIRSAKSVKDGRALAGWLHGVAVRVSLKRKRSAARQRLREHRVATREAERPVPEAAWNELLAAVHEEVQRLPDSLRTAFVLCELEGVRQGEASERLGWKPGTLTGRLTRARQMLIERLARRGLAPTVAGVSLGVGVATAAAEVPHRLIDTALSLTQAGGAVSPAVLKLASEGLPMMMRTKLAAGLLVVAGGLSAVLYPMASAQVREEARSNNGLPPPTPSVPGAPPGAAGTPAIPPSDPAIPRTPTPPKAGWSQPGMSAPTPPMPPMPASAPRQWEYRIVDNLLGKYKDDEMLTELLNRMGKDGWEFCGSFSMTPGAGHAGIFKRPKGSTVFRTITYDFDRGTGNFKPATGYTPPVAAIPSSIPPMTAARPSMSGVAGPPAPPMPGLTFPGRSPGAELLPEAPLTILKLRNVAATEMAGILEKVFSGALITITPVPHSNSLIIRANEKTLKELKALLQDLDVPLPMILPSVRPPATTGPTR